MRKSTIFLNKPRDFEKISHDLLHNGVILDSEILLLLLMGSANENQIGQGKLSRYTKEQYWILIDFIGKAKSEYVTSQIAPEVSNHIINRNYENSFNSYHQYSNTEAMVQYFCKNESNEEYKNSGLLCGNDFIYNLGITDVSILLLAKEKDLVVITGDEALYKMLYSQGVSVITCEELVAIKNNADIKYK